LQKKAVEQLSITDQLTGLSNRRHLDNVLALEIKRHIRHAHSLSLMMIDVDHFKSVNDSFGHDVGDAVLVAFAELFTQGVRQSDTVGRWGGEEFLVVCPETDLEGVLTLAEHLRQRVCGFHFPEVGNLTSSFGVTCLRRGDTASELLRKADTALYQAKQGGRNRIMAV